MHAQEILKKLDVTEDTRLFVLRINCQGAAFAGLDIDDDPAEIVRILRNLASALEDHSYAASLSNFATLRDFNGNACGSATLKPAEYWTAEGRWPAA